MSLNSTLLAGIPRINRIVFLIGLAGILAGIVGIKLSHDPVWIRFFDNLHWTSGTAAAAVLAWLGWRNFDRQASSATLRWFAIGFTGYAIGQLVWDAQVILDYSKFPSPSDLFYLWLGPCLTIGLIQEIRSRPHKLNTQITLLDVASLTIASLTIVLVMYVPRRGELDLLSMAVLISYPVSLLVPTCIGLIMIPTLRLHRSSGFNIFLLSVAVTAWSWMEWNSMALNGASINGAWFNTSFSFAILFAGLAVSVWRLEYSDSPEWDRQCEAFLRMLPILAIVLACGAIVTADSIPDSSAHVAMLTDIGSALIIVLAVIRQGQLLKERDQLLASQAEALKTGMILKFVIDTAPIRVFWKDRNLRYMGGNLMLAHDAGFFHPDELIGKTDYELGWKSRAERYQADDMNVIESGIPQLDVEETMTARDGRTFWWRTSKVPLRKENDGEIIGVLGIYDDISERKQIDESLRQSEQMLRSFYDLGLVGLTITSPEKGWIRINDYLCEMLEYSEQELRQMTWTQLTHPADLAEDEEQFRRMLDNEINGYELETRFVSRSGKVIPTRLVVRCVRKANGEADYVTAMIENITERKQSEERIRYLAFYDVLTQLPNRRLLMDRINLALSVSARSNQYGALLFLDLDRFKLLNDRLGHDYGDLLLTEVAERIRFCVRDVDTVARLGGDEFVVLIENISPNAEDASQRVAHIAEKIRDMLTMPYQIKGHENYSSPSIGVCLYCGSGESADDLLKHADMAMYQAKNSGRNTIRFFDPQMQHAVEIRAALESDLRFAVSAQQLRLYYQIQMDVDNRPIGVEALVRWMHPVRGIVLPMQFIPVAEESSLIQEIGHWVLDKACQQIALWGKNEQTRNLSIAVNVSAHQFGLENFVEIVAALVRAHRIEPSRLKLELTESVILNDVADIVTKMHALKALDIGLSLDDFGTGYSSLSYLKQLPLDQLKIDQSFVRDITTDPNDAVMVQTIIGMAKNFGLNVIAEGVETESQLKFLKQNGCMAYQGYFFGKPLPIEEFEKFLSAHHAR